MPPMETRILGIDPGLRITGYGCIEASAERPRLVEAGVLRLGAPSGSANANGSAKSDARSVSARLAELDGDVRDLLERLKPELVAVESLFAHYKHPTTAIVMGHARGVILLAIRRAGIELAEFRPNMVKKSLTGHGHADKGQMQRAVQAQFGLAEAPKPPDVADAIAIALCAARRVADARASSVTGADAAVTRTRVPGKRDSLAALKKLAAGVRL